MLKYKFLLIVVITGIFFNLAYSVEKKSENLNLKKLYNQAFREYKIKDYYSAIDDLYKIIKYPKSPYYAPSLFLLSKIYISIGRKTGIKTYLTAGLYFLNLYLGKKKKVGWDYYYTKGNLYEVLGFYERAMFFYKTSLFMTKDKNKYYKSLIGILRTAIWYKKLDIITQYAIKLSAKKLLQNIQDPEVRFLKGLLLFQNGKYNEAYKYLYKTYKEFESYLIDNPEFYFVVAENMYRIGKLDFAKQLFRRIVSITQNQEIIRKSMLRLGDIDIIQKDYPTAFNHYYYLANNYKKTKEATIAKLKIIGYRNIPEFNKRILRAKDEWLKEPFRFVYFILITNRNNSVGRYALADFGNFIFKYNSKLLYDKLSWELSVLEIARFNYQEREYIRKLWKKDLLNIEPKWLCLVFSSNKRFFYEIFNKEFLIKISQRVSSCNNKYKIEILKFLVDKYKDDKSKFLLGKAYFEIGEYKKSLNILNKIIKKDCKTNILISKNYIMLDKLETVKKHLPKIRKCKEKESSIILASYKLYKDDINNAYKLFYRNLDLIKEKYKNSSFYKKVLDMFANKTINFGNYNLLYQVLSKLSETYKQDCNINSWYLITKIRINKINNIDEIYKRISSCNNKWANIAKNIYQDFRLFQEVKK
ncbi:tetratricopeptide repeat protein [Hydrogenothermus marinus]|uniref:Tetratricopeptide repeat protein n=1 Tax=Hydrogenothermus marinus TaxID=133270 RepID=A0A3M0BJV0_9AQUI|nr:hypothetical protein [Hydrogenothermus marinus]RMA97491.1 hypothetical protein CLV39_0104 [Hydrogenothermus marinus]